MSKYTRYQSVVSRNTDEHVSEDHWLKQFEKNLSKDGVQSKSQVSLFDQISSVMNGAKPKYPSVQAAVDDMMQRSGLTSYLKTSKEKSTSSTKTAADQNDAFYKEAPVEEKQTTNDNMPEVIRQAPVVLKTLENYVKSTRGNLSIPAIIDKIRSIHRADVADDKLWDDDRLLHLVSRLNLEAKKNNPSTYQDYSNLATSDHDNADSDVDPSNTDAFNALMPAKL